MVSDKWEIAQRTMIFLLSNIILFTLSGKIFFSLYLKNKSENSFQYWPPVSYAPRPEYSINARGQKRRFFGNLFKNHTLWLWLNFLSASNDRASTDLFCSSLCIYRIFQFCPTSNFVHFSNFQYSIFPIFNCHFFTTFQFCPISRVRLKISILFLFRYYQRYNNFI